MDSSVYRMMYRLCPHPQFTQPNFFSLCDAVEMRDTLTATFLLNADHGYILHDHGAYRFLINVLSPFCDILPPLAAAVARRPSQVARQNRLVRDLTTAFQASQRHLSAAMGITIPRMDEPVYIGPCDTAYMSLI